MLKKGLFSLIFFMMLASSLQALAQSVDTTGLPVTIEYGDHPVRRPTEVRQIQQRIQQVVPSYRRNRQVVYPVYIMMPPANTRETPRPVTRLQPNVRVDTLTAQVGRLGRMVAQQNQQIEALQKELAARQTETTYEMVEWALLEDSLFVTQEISFAFGDSTLAPTSKAVLDRVGAVLQDHPDWPIEIGGHTDSTGVEAYNLFLSQKRAEAVRNYLLRSFHIDPEQLVAVGYGESRPIFVEPRRNRRVEFVRKPVVGQEE